MTDRNHHHTIPWRRVIAVVAVMFLGFALLWMLIRAFGETEYDPVEPTAATSPAQSTKEPLATPTETSEEEATPDAPEWPAGSLPALLAMAPDRLSDDSLPLNDVAQYSDIAGWLRANGLTSATAPDEAWREAMDTLAIPASLSEFGLDPIWLQVYGFDMRQVDQVLVLGQAPDYVIFMTGDFDANALQSAWVSSGYQAVEERGNTIWSLYPGDQIDLSAPESRPAMGTMNNVVVLEDGTLVASARLSRLVSVMDVVDGNATSLADQEDVSAILAADPTIASLTSAVLARGTLLQGNDSSLPQMSTPVVSSSPAATEEVSEEFSTVSLLLSGLILDQDGTARMDTWLVFETSDAATTALPMVRSRLSQGTSPITDAPYTDRLGNPSVRRVEKVVVVEATLTEGAADWQAILQSRDLGFAFWLTDDD